MSDKPDKPVLNDDETAKMYELRFVRDFIKTGRVLNNVLHFVAKTSFCKDAEDIAHEVVVSLYKYPTDPTRPRINFFHKYNPDITSFPYAIFVICKRVTINYIKKVSRRREEHLIDGYQDLSFDNFTFRLNYEHTVKDLGDFIPGVSYFSVYKRLKDGYKVTHIARMYGIKTKMVKSVIEVLKIKVLSP